MSEGASANERLRYAARQDDASLAMKVLQGEEGKLNVNWQDGLGMTALHYAAEAAALEVLELILEHDGTDVDLQNRMDRDTPLHLAARLKHPEARRAVVSSLLDAGADVRIRNKAKQLPSDLLSPPPEDNELRSLMRKAEAELNMGVANVAEDSDRDGDSGSD